MLSKPLAYTYIRHSTKEQAKGDSRKRQMDRATQWAEANGYTIKELYDSGRSAFTGDNLIHGQLGRFVDGLKNGEMGPTPVLLIEAFDRFSRLDVAKALGLFSDLIERGATIVVLGTAGNVMTYKAPLSMQDMVIALVAMDGANLYSRNLSKNVKHSVETRKANGVMLHNRGSCPPWLQITKDRKSWIILDAQVELVRNIFEMARKGMGPAVIARHLRHEKIPKFRGTAGWSSDLIYRLLNDRRVLGEFRREGETQIRENYFPPIITPELFFTINEKKAKVARGGGNGKLLEHNLLRGIAVGPEGDALIHRTSGIFNKTENRMVYHKYLQGKGDRPLRVRYQLVEDRLLWFLENVGSEMIESIRVRKADETSQRIKDQEDRVAGIDHQLAKFKKLFLTHDKIPDTLVEEMERLEDEKRRVGRAIEQLRHAQAKRIEAVSLGGDLKDPAVRRAIRAKITEAVLKLVVSKEHMDVYFFEDSAFRVFYNRDSVEPFTPPYADRRPPAVESAPDAVQDAQT